MNIIQWIKGLFSKPYAETRINGMSNILTTLEVFSEGQPWPITSQAERISNYDQWDLMLNNEHDSLITEELKRVYPDDEEYKRVRLVKLDYYRATNEAIADLEFGEEPEFICSNQEYLRELRRNTRFNDVIASFDNDLKTYGNAVLKVRKEDNQVYIDNINPRYWFPVVELLNFKKITHVIAFDYSQDNAQYLKIEIHTPGKVETRIHFINSGRIGKAAVEPETVETGLTISAVVSESLAPTGEKIFCKSDFEKYKSIVTALEVELSKIGYNLDKQGKLLYGPQSALQRNQSTGKWEFKKNSYLPVDKEDSNPGVVTFDAQITQALEYINNLQEKYYIASGTNAALFSKDSGNAPSGTALKRLLQRPLSKASRIVNRIKHPLETALLLASEMDAKAIKEISSQWKDGLVNDETEDTTNYSNRIVNGWLSKQTALQRLDKLSDTDAKKELELILAERKQESAINLDDLYGNEADNSGNQDNSGTSE